MMGSKPLPLGPSSTIPTLRATDINDDLVRQIRFPLKCIGWGQNFILSLSILISSTQLCIQCRTYIHYSYPGRQGRASGLNCTFISSWWGITSSWTLRPSRRRAADSYLFLNWTVTTPTEHKSNDLTLPVRALQNSRPICSTVERASIYESGLLFYYV